MPVSVVNHIHVHSEKSALDGLSPIKTLIKKAKDIGSTALGLTDHGVMGGIADFIYECDLQGIKPLPGVEAYLAKNRLLHGEEMARMRDHLAKEYKLIDKKGKYNKKQFNQFIKDVKFNLDQFEELATPLLKNYLMESGFDLFDIIDFDNEESNSDKIEKFKKNILSYIDYKESGHLLLIAMNNQGLKDLYKINSDAHINGFYSDPRTDLKHIRKNNLGNNIIATSACLGGTLARYVMQGRYQDAVEFIAECKETFHSFYLEKQAVISRDQIAYNDELDRLSIQTNTPKVMTTDVHFANKEDHKIHDILVAGSMKKCILDEDRYIYSEDHYMKTLEEIQVNFRDDEAIANTHKIAEMVDVTLPKEPIFPLFPVEEGDSAETILRKKSWAGLFQYCLKNSHLDFDKYARQMEFELDVICNEGFADYFLITEDFINAAKKENFFVGPGRGSAAGSLTCFILDITTLDPIENNLLFERFLNPERAGYPDIDIDMGEAGSFWTQMYLKRKYGKEHVAQIGTDLTLAPKSVCKFVIKALGYSQENYNLENAFAGAIPDDVDELSKAYSQSEDLQKYVENYPDVWNAALKLEGHQRSVGVHASGVVISPEPLTNTVPLRLDSTGLETTEYDMEWIEKFLVKFDLLKLSTLDLIERTMKYAGVLGQLDINNIDLNDTNIYEKVYRTNQLDGIFQVESEGMRKVIEELKPNCFEDIGVVVALYRPGPMDLIPNYINRKFGREKVVYPFDELEPVLKETYGIYVYQEQLMQSSQIIGGLTLGQADMIRKGTAKKLPKIMNRWIDLMIYGDKRYKEIHQERIQQYPNEEDIPTDEDGEKNIWVDYAYEEVPYVEGGINRGFDEEGLLKLKDNWVKFGSYAFNKAHSSAYAKISVQTAYLKCYYPTAFMASLLTQSEGKKNKNKVPKNIEYMQRCEEMGIQIVRPDINESSEEWTPVIEETTEGISQTIRYGLTSIAGISEETVLHIMEQRPYHSVEELINKTNKSKVNTAKITALIKAGAFDSINNNRNVLLKDLQEIKGNDLGFHKDKTSKSDIITYERETLGVSVSYKSRWQTIPDGKTNVQFTGEITELDPFVSKKGQEHCRLIFTTSEDELNCMIFNKNWMPLKNQLVVGQKLTIKGKKDNDKLLVNQVSNK